MADRERKDDRITRKTLPPRTTIGELVCLV